MASDLVKRERHNAMANQHAYRIGQLTKEVERLNEKLEKAIAAMTEALGAYEHIEAEWIIKDALAELKGDSE
jgi:hypothetical protein